MTEQNRHPEAIAQGSVLEGFHLQYPDLFCGLAEVYLDMHRDAEARRYAEKAIAVNPAYQRAIQVIRRLNEPRADG